MGKNILYLLIFFVFSASAISNNQLEDEEFYRVENRLEKCKRDRIQYLRWIEEYKLQLQESTLRATTGLIYDRSWEVLPPTSVIALEEKKEGENRLSISILNICLRRSSQEIQQLEQRKQDLLDKVRGLRHLSLLPISSNFLQQSPDDISGFGRLLRLISINQEVGQLLRLAQQKRLFPTGELAELVREQEKGEIEYRQELSYLLKTLKSRL